MAMNTVKLSRMGNTQLVAHRGLSGLEKENTCAAFVAAGNRSYFGIETDIHRTADDQYILIHDGETGRVAVDNRSVEGSPLAALREVAMTDIDGKVRGDLQLPLPEEYLRICKKYDKVAVLEFKGRYSKDMLTEVRGLVKKYHDEAHTIYISFDYENLTALRELTDEVQIQYLCGDLTEEQLQDMAARRIGADAYFGSLSAEKVAHMHELGLVVNCWTVDDVETAQRLMGWGVDYITTDILEFTDC